jgi:hypothetical protein
MSSSWFSDNGSSGERLAAAVFWRGQGGGWKQVDSPRSTIVHALIGVLFVKTRILPLLWRRGFMAWIHGSFQAADEWEAQMRRPDPDDGGGWTSSAGDGEDRVRYDRRRGVIGIRSRVFGPPPPGHTLLLLVEEDSSAPDGLRVIERFVAVPSTSGRPPHRPGLSKQERLKVIRSHLREREAIWSAAVSADPEYQRFVGGRT